MPTIKYSGNISGVAPGDYVVSVTLSDKASNQIQESTDTPITVPAGGGPVVVGPPDLVVVE